VVDQGNNRLEVLSFDGQTFGYLDSFTAGFNAPTGVAVDAKGNIVVADTGNNRVVVLDTAGNLVAEYTEPNDGYTGSFNAPRSVAVEADGDLVVADTGNQRVVTIRRAEYRIYLPLVLNDYLPAGTDCQELIQNGSFEEDAAWVIGATPRPARYTTEQAHSGNRSILLGLKPGESDVYSYSSVRQAITVPAAVDSATLTFWYYPLSDLDASDYQECILLDQDGATLAILLRTNANTAAWTGMSYDLRAYAGQTIWVYFDAYNDGGGNGVTGFYLDDVSVKSCTVP
jgi:DNA-binding beta-propeller fold protein YncE